MIYEIHLCHLQIRVFMLVLIEVNGTPSVFVGAEVKETAQHFLYLLLVLLLLCFLPLNVA